MLPQGMMGRIFDIQRFSIHDGPGIRTTVFLKGCPMECFWCQNPEGISAERQLQFVASRCTRCRECAKACPVEAHVFDGDAHVVRRDRCTLCGDCAEVCLAGALKIVGQERSLQEIVDIVAQDRVYYEQSGGGVTLSGGEPLMQPEFACDLLAACRGKGIHTALDTSLYCAREVLDAVMPLTDLFLIDIKHMDTVCHKEGTGHDNAQILANAEALAAAACPVIVRVPVVPSFNDSPDSIRAIAEFATRFKTLEHIELLPFHRLGESKYRSLGMQARTSRLGHLSEERMSELAGAARAAGIPVKAAWTKREREP